MFKHILIATEGSGLAEQAANHGLELANKLNAEDKGKVDQLFTGIRELENSLQAGGGSCMRPATPSASTDIPTIIEQMNTLMVIAAQCDVTRVMTFMLGDALNEKSVSYIPEIKALGGDAADHAQSHHNGDATKLGRLGPGGLRAALAGCRQFTELIRAENPGLPLVILGHSWGSFLAQKLVNEHPEAYDAVVLSGSSLLWPGSLNAGSASSLIGVPAAPAVPANTTGSTSTTTAASSTG